MKFIIGMIILFGALGTLQAQTRTWSFSQETVKSGARFGTSVDSVSITNAGSDTLKFDTVTLELIRPPASSSYALLFSSTANDFFVWNYSSGVQFSNPPPQSVRVPPAQSLRLRRFSLSDYPYAILAKRSVTTASGDSMQVRLIFQAASGRGRDTVVVSGLQESTAIRMPGDAPGLRENPDAEFFDLRGRRIEAMEKGVKVPWAPVVSPRE